MSTGWIKIDKDMIDDPRVVDAAQCLASKYIIAHTTTVQGGTDLTEVELLRFACNAVTGALVTLWKYADEHIRDDDTLPITRDALDALLGITGFFELMPIEWVDELDDGTIILPGYCEKNALIAKKKAALKSNARVQAFRARKNGKCNAIGNAHVTQVTPRYPSVTKVVDQDQDIPKKENKKQETPLPPSGLDLNAWEKWTAYRTAIKKPIRPPSITAAMAEMVTHGAAQGAVVQHSIANSYQGLFAPKANGKTGGAKLDDSAEWAELRAHAQAIGFRAPMQLESMGAYRTDMKMFEITPANRRDLSQALGALKAHLTT